MLLHGLLGPPRAGSLLNFSVHFRSKATSNFLGISSPSYTVDSMPRLHQIIKGIQISKGKDGKPSHSRLPITPGIWIS